MIRPIQITLNAAHPELPLVEASTFVGSPSTAFVRGVPATVGSWSITAVRLVFAYPDNSIVTANCVNAASGVWVGTIAPTATSGRTANGYQVLADGIDENGNAVTGYVLGMGDLAVYTRDLTIDGAAGVKWYLHYFDTAPATPKKGDVAKVNGLICLYDGTAWVSFGDGPGFSTDAPAMDGTASAGVAETAARSDHVHPTDTTRASTADATLTPVYGEWVCNPAKVLYGDPSQPTEVAVAAYKPDGADVWALSDLGNAAAHSTTFMSSRPYDPAATSLTFTIDSAFITRTVTATRAVVGYRLGPDEQTNPNRDKPVASEAEAEALRQGKQSALSDAQLANIAAVSDALAFDAANSYAAGDPVVYNGTLYTFTATHTGAWTGGDVSAVDIISRLAGKLDKSDVVAPSSSATTGQAADAKATGDALDPLLFAQYYPDGSVTGASDFTQGIKYDAPNTTNRTITVKPFCNTGMATNDNSSLVGRVVIPPFVDGDGNPYISDDGTRFKVIGVANGMLGNPQTALTAIVVPNTVTSIGDFAFFGCASLVSVSLFSVKTIKTLVFNGCRSLTSLFLPAATSIENGAFGGCTSLASTDFGSDLSSVPTLGSDVFFIVPTTCKIIVPDAQYDAWIAASGWSDLVTAGYKFLRHSEWEYARKYEVEKKADKPATFTTGNLAALDASGNPTDAGWTAGDLARYPLVAKTIDNGAVTLDDRAMNAVAVSSALASLTINFPTATSGKVRDFGLRLTVASGITTAPELALPQGVVCENADGEAPEIGADGAATILYFTETASGVFLVKGEVVTAIS